MICPKCKTNNTLDSQFCKKCATLLPTSENASVSHTRTLETLVSGLKIGSTFTERYDVLEDLGKGGMGEVYKVKDKDLDENIALKVLGQAESVPGSDQIHGTVHQVGPSTKVRL